MQTSAVHSAMPKKSKLKLKPVDFGEESLGQRLARLRKERGFTQKQLPREPASFRSWFPTTRRTSCASTPR